MVCKQLNIEGAEDYVLFCGRSIYVLSTPKEKFLARLLEKKDKKESKIAMFMLDCIAKNTLESLKLH